MVATAAALALLSSGCTGGAESDSSGSTPTADVEETSPAPVPTGVAEATTSPTPSPGPSPSVTEIALRVERRTDDVATAGFVEEAMEVLTDPRGWQRAGFRFVADDDGPYLLVLADGDEVDRLCEPYDTGGRFSCQNGPVVALNADRWREATPEWQGDLSDYRTYLVNHEVGHLLHLHHPSPQCPGEGLPAPVMLQQTTELDACTANPWPLPWEIDLAAEQLESLAPPAEHDVTDHQPAPPAQQQDLDHLPGGT